MNKKILLVDGYSILFRAFYGMPLSMTTPDGVHTNAVYGFLAILRKVIEEEQPDYIAVAFDKKAPTFRHKMYEAYKGNRQAAPPEFHEQVPLVKELLESMDITHLSLEGWEADDILGTLSRKAEAEGIDVSLVSGDRDLLQIATDKTEIIIPKTSKGQTTYEHYYASDVYESLGVTPLEFIDMKALMGDSSDNIPGLPGVGPKTAAAIISTYHSIENAQKHVDEIKPKKAQTAMREHYDLAVLSKDLATIRLDAPIDVNIEDLTVKNIYNERSYDVIKKLNFKSLFKFFESESSDKAPEAMVSIVNGKSECESVYANAFFFLMNSSAGSRTIGIDVVCERHQAYAYGLAYDGKYYGIPVSDEIDAEYLSKKNRDLMLDAAKNGVRVATCNGKSLLKLTGIPMAETLFDVIVAAYLIDPLKSDWKYDDVASGYMHATVKSEEELIGKKGPGAFAKSEPDKTEVLASMAGLSAYAAAGSADALLTKLKEEEMENLFNTIEMPLVSVLASMECAGILASREELRKYGDRLEDRINELTKEIYEEAGEQFNINSPKQLGVILFEKMKLKGGKKTKTGYSTAADVLEKLAPEAKIVANILEYRTYSKLKSTYADGLQNCIEEDGRIRTTFNQTITATGRLSSTDPNLQNIPMREDLGRRIRKCFYPKDGCVFVDADYSQIELRVLAHMSGDEKLIEAYREAKDIHAATASQVFHVPYEEVTDQQRRNAKAVNFGIVYGQSSFGLSQGLSISRKEAQDYINDYFKTYPKIKAFLDGLVASAKEKGYAVSVFGRRRPVPELKASNFMQRSFGERVAMNSPIQGTAADIMKIAMNRVYGRLMKEGLKSRLILQIHDELLIEAPAEEAEYAKKILEEEMRAAANLSVALETDCHIGTDWYEAK